MSQEKKYSKAFKNLLSHQMFPVSNITVENIMNMLQALRIRHNLSQVAIHDVFQYTKVLAGPDHEHIDISQWYQKKFNAPSKNVKLFTFYCPVCSKVLEELCEDKYLKVIKQSVCSDCKKTYNLKKSNNSNYYINLDLKFQIQTLLSDSKILDSVVKRVRQIRRQNLENEVIGQSNIKIRDIYDAELYRNNVLIRGEDSEKEVILTMCCNVDGASMKHRTVYSLWSILCQLNELPTHLRFKVVFAASLWYVKREPKPEEMKMYLGTFLKQFQDLMNTGFELPYEGQKIRIRVIPLFFPVDAIARGILTNRINVSGYYGCNWCYVYGIHKGAVRFPLNLKPKPGETKLAELRTHEEYLKDVQKREEYLCEKPQIRSKVLSSNRGIKGKMAFIDKIPGFDAIYSFPFEYLHALGLGVMKTFQNLITSAKFEKNLSPADRLKLDNRLISIRPLCNMYRTPETMTNKSAWNGADWLHYLLFSSIPCLDGIVDDEIMELLLILNNNTNIFLSNEISSMDLKNSEKECVVFQEMWQKIFKEEGMTSNVHAFLHGKVSVEKCGPFWSSSAFVHESKIAQLKEDAIGPARVPIQIADRIGEYYEYRNKLTKELHGKIDPTSLFCNKIFFKQSAPISGYIESAEGAKMFTRYTNRKNTFSRCYYRDMLLHSTDYTLAKKTDDTVIRLTNRDIAQVKYFFCDDSKHAYMCVDIFTTKPYKVGDRTSLNIFKVHSKQFNKFLPVNCAESKIVHIEIPNESEWVIIPPLMLDIK